LDSEGLILDVTPGAARFERSFLERLGHPVLVCHGPAHEPCPLITEDSCDMLDAAHGVVFQLDLDRAEHRRILQRYQEVLNSETPLRVVVLPGQEITYADLLEDAWVWTHEPSAGELDGFAAQVEAVDSATEPGEQRPD
jgi:hypothetical protein